MRTSIVLLGLTALLAAQEGEAPEKPASMKAVLKDGKLTLPVWNLTLTAHGLEEAAFKLGGPRIIFEGTCDAGTVELSVSESAEVMTSQQWFDQARAAWKRSGRKHEEETSGNDPQPWTIFVEESLSGARKHHGYLFHARGNQLFELHVFADEKTETSGEAIQQVLRGLSLGEDPKAALLVLLVAQQAGRPVDDPMVLFQAGMAYFGDGQRPPNFPLAARVLARARAKDKEGVFNPQQRYFLYERGGLAHLSRPLRDAKAALSWHQEAEKIAKAIEGAESNAATSAYNIACAYSILGDKEKGYEALYRAFTYVRGGSVDDAHLAADEDLANLRADTERWKKFLAEKDDLAGGDDEAEQPEEPAEEPAEEEEEPEQPEEPEEPEGPEPD